MGHHYAIWTSESNFLLAPNFFLGPAKVWPSFQALSKMSRSQEFSWLIDDSNNYVMYCYACRKAGPDIADKTEFVTGKKFKREIIVYHNKTKSLKYENCLNLVSEKAHSSNKLVSIF